MLSKCANPECKARLRYLREGKIFRVDAPPAQNGKRPPAKADLDEAQTITRRVLSGTSAREYFWLCGDCAEEMTLAVRNAAVVLVPTRPAQAQHAAAS